MIRQLGPAPLGVVARMLFLCATLPAAVGRGETAQWLEPTIDTWLYTNSITSGARMFGPTFGSLFVDSGTNQFQPGSDQGPTRLGMTLVAFETNDQISTLNDPSRYEIESVAINAWATKTGEGPLYYSEQPYTPASLLADAQSGGLSSQQPVELFGVGFTSLYDGFDLGVNSGESFFSEADEPYDGPTGPYAVYPVVGDGAGGYQDVSNNLTGGFSATAPGNSTGVFDAPAWAIGDGYSVNTSNIEDPGAPYNEGDLLPLITRYEFSLNLSAPGVEEYLQQGLADGALGFMLSSVHPASQPGTSTNPEGYIDWRFKEAFANFSIRLEIDYSIMPLAGDYNNDGTVDQFDHTTWVNAYGATVTPAGTGADGNGDGVVDAADYTVWRDNVPAMSVPVPEPVSGVLMLWGMCLVACWSGTFLFGPRRAPNKD